MDRLAAMLVNADTKGHRMTHRNEELTRRAYDAFGQGDVETLSTMMSDQVSWYVPGNNPMSGEYHGKEEVFGFFKRVAEATRGTFRIEIHDVLANDDHAVALVKTYGERNGVSLDGAPQAHVIHVEDEQVVSFWNHPYEGSVFDEFWS